MGDTDLLQALARCKQSLGDLSSRYASNNAIALAAPHASNCAWFKRSQWHQPVVIDSKTGEPRDATEADCNCWKSNLTAIDGDEGATRGSPGPQSYESRIDIEQAVGDRFELFLILCLDFKFTPGMGGGPGSGDYCIGRSKDYADLLYRTMSLIGELKIQKFRVFGYRVSGILLNVQTVEAGVK